MARRRIDRHAIKENRNRPGRVGVVILQPDAADEEGRVGGREGGVDFESRRETRDVRDVLDSHGLEIRGAKACLGDRLLIVGIALLGGDQDFFDAIAVGSPGGCLAEVIVIAIVIALVVIPAALPAALIQNFSGLKGVLLGESGICTDHQEHEHN